MNCHVAQGVRGIDGGIDRSQGGIVQNRIAGPVIHLREHARHIDQPWIVAIRINQPHRILVSIAVQAEVVGVEHAIITLAIQILPEDRIGALPDAGSRIIVPGPEVVQARGR